MCSNGRGGCAAGEHWCEALRRRRALSPELVNSETVVHDYPHRCTVSLPFGQYQTVLLCYTGTCLNILHAVGHYVKNLFDGSQTIDLLTQRSEH